MSVAANKTFPAIFNLESLTENYLGSEGCKVGEHAQWLGFFCCFKKKEWRKKKPTCINLLVKLQVNMV